MGTDLHEAILEGADEIAVPALLSTLCICIVFVPMFFLTGAARFLVRAVRGSRGVRDARVLRAVAYASTDARDAADGPRAHAPDAHAKPNLFMRLHRRFDHGFERMHGAYIVILSTLLVKRRLYATIFLGFCVVSAGLVFVLGEDFFPTVDAGDIRMHMRTPTGTRIEETARLADDEVEKVVRQVVPRDQLSTILDNLGLPYSDVNLSYSNAGTIGTLDGEIQVPLNENHNPTQTYIDELRARLPKLFPGTEFFFQPADIVTQILNFGLPAAIDVQIQGQNQEANFQAISNINLMKKIRMIPGNVDTHIQQKLDEHQSTYNHDVANLAAADANVKRLRQLESFKRIVVPFAGVVTQRNVDVCDLIDAGSGTSRALFAFAQPDPLRLFVQMPQAYTQNVSVGQDVVVTQAELPGQQFHGQITHVPPGAIDMPTRSLQLEERLPNPDGRLRPGAYVQVAVPSVAHARLMVPGDGLLFRAEGPRLAVVDKDGHVRLHKIVIPQDLGQTLEIESGIEPTDKVITNPSDSIADSDHVMIVPPSKQGPQHGASDTKAAS